MKEFKTTKLVYPIRIFKNKRKKRGKARKAIERQDIKGMNRTNRTVIACFELLSYLPKMSPLASWWSYTFSSALEFGLATYLS